MYIVHQSGVQEGSIADSWIPYTNSIKKNKKQILINSDNAQTHNWGDHSVFPKDSN
jgi:hypothetical protein